MAIKSLLLVAALLSLSITLHAAEASSPGQALSLIQQDLAKATETLNHATELLRKETERGQWERYGTCVEELRAAVSRSLPNAASNVKAGSYGGAVDELKATVQHADNCENQFGESIVSQLKDQIMDVDKLAMEAIDVIKGNVLRSLRF